MNRRLEIIFGLSSLAGIVLSGIVTIFALVKGEYGAQSSVVIVSLAAINVALAIVCIHVVRENFELCKYKSEYEPRYLLAQSKLDNLKSDFISREENYTEVSSILHSIQDQIRDRVFELYSAYVGLLDGDEIEDVDLISYSRTNEMFYLFVLDNIKNAFELLTGSKCSVCIKILVEDEQGGDIMVRPFMRDSNSYRERKITDRLLAEYPYYENTAFKTILSSEPISYYVCDDLKGRQSYNNPNSVWSEHYNATLVCPIRIEAIEEVDTEVSEYSILGFLCVDNVSGGLEKQVCIQTLAGIADSLYNHFLLYDELRSFAIGSEEN